MASTVPDDVSEYPDPPELVQSKITQLAELVRQSQYIVVYTGAGVSTSAAGGIPDFRGPNGVWAGKAQGLETSRGFDAPLMPTPTHMALVRLYQIGKLQFLVSQVHVSYLTTPEIVFLKFRNGRDDAQNTDGLHVRSGIPPDRIAELHGNNNVELCTSCGKKYYRSLNARAPSSSPGNETGRSCTKCNGPLRDSIAHFGESLPKDALATALAHSSKADLAIVLGSLMRVSPESDMPLLVAESGRPLAIVNLQRTPLDPLATLRIGAPTDLVLSSVLTLLGEMVPEPQDLGQALEEASEREARREMLGPVPGMSAGLIDEGLEEEFEGEGDRL